MRRVEVGNLLIFSASCAIYVSVMSACDLHANQSFYKDHAKGWHWYEKKAADEIELEKVKKPASIITPSQTPTEKVAAIRKDAEEKLNKALISPTEKNVASYIIAQEKIGDRSEKFSEIWQKVIFKNPSLDRTIKNPVSSNALHIARKDEIEQKRQKIRGLSKEYGLMYFFKGDCKGCQAFSSVVKNFASSYNWNLMPIQVGDVVSHEFPNAKKDNGAVERLGITHVPALIAVHPKTGDMIPLAFSYIAEDEIEDRVNALVGNPALASRKQLIAGTGLADNKQLMMGNKR